MTSTEVGPRRPVAIQASSLFGLTFVLPYAKMTVV